MGPLDGVKIIELAGIGPCPMCGMLLAELGATILRIERVQPVDIGIELPREHAFLHRSRPAITLDLKKDSGIAIVLKLCEQADALIEGLRPGVMERLGLGPEPCRRRNPSLVYGRVTGWGQSGPLSKTAGHDLNYIAITGTLDAIGRKNQPPTPPLNLVGDYGGGALYLALGVLAALIESKHSGQGQVVDAAMVDGAASLMTAAYALHNAGISTGPRGTNILDSGAHFYDVYETSDAHHIALAAIEPKFFAELRRLLGLNPESLPHSQEPTDWPVLKKRIEALIKTRTRDEWIAILEGSDACFAPVLTMKEAPFHPHNKARQTFIQRDGQWQPNASPRFSRTPSAVSNATRITDRSTQAMLLDWGLDETDIALLLKNEAASQSSPKGPASDL